MCRVKQIQALNGNMEVINMCVKTSEEKIKAMREMRKTHTEAEVAKKFGVSSCCVNTHCKDMGINFRKNPPKPVKITETARPTIKCDTYGFDKLSDEDKKRYLECRPPDRQAELKTFIIGKKNDYGSAVCFEDQRANRYVKEY